MLLVGLWVVLPVVPELLYGVTESVVLAVGFSAAVVSGAHISHYQYLRQGFEHRKQMAERAELVPCSVQHTYVGSMDFKLRSWYFPVVEFEYRRDGFRKQSLYSHPDGVYEVFADADDALAAAERLSSEAGDAAYYDPETNRAFLCGKAHPGPIRMQVLAGGAVSAVFLLVGVFVLLNGVS